MNLQKLLKALPAGYAEEAEGMSVAQLKASIIEAEQNVNEVESEKEGDEKLSGAKELVKDLSSPYRDAIKAQRAKIKYALFQIEQKGTK